MQQLAQIELQQMKVAVAGWAFWAWRHDKETTMLSAWSMRQLLRQHIFEVPPATTHSSNKLQLDAIMHKTKTGYARNAAATPGMTQANLVLLVAALAAVVLF